MKVVVCDYVFPNLCVEREELSSIPGVEIADAKCTCEEEVIEACRDADAILNQYNYITPKVIDSLRKCQVISTYGIGTDRIDVEYATKKGIFVCNSPEYNKYEVCNHTILLILALSRQLVQFDRRMRNGEYAIPFSDMYLSRPMGQTVGFVGFGRIGQQIADKLHNAFGMNVICYDPYLSEKEIMAAGGKKKDLESVMKEADFISVNVSLSKETFHLINRDFLNMMKPSAYIINCARGSVIDETALIELLQNKRIAGAALDTFENEPLPKNHPLLMLDNVITTPHAAWYTHEALKELQWGAAHQVSLILSGKEPTHAVNYDAVKKKRAAWGSPF